MTGSSHPGCGASSHAAGCVNIDRGRQRAASSVRVERRAREAGEQRHLSEHTYVAHKRVNFTDDETRRKRLRQADEPLTADTETDFPVVDLEVA
ncbi:hypothetical protein B0G74_5831 [Paraburkholderia sp. BL9I2N2]|jgi:hypothetical protein|nr:hypothetical protein B0G74_5831 [Paraburkholderia sp. BL9I2N2]